MNDIVIKAEGLSKRYRIGVKEAMHDNLVGAFVDFIKKPVCNFRKYRSLYKFDDERGCNADNSYKNEVDIVWALREVTFEVKKGEVLGIIGRNGAGKSTLLKILSRITVPTSGYAELRGRVSSLLEVGTGFHPDLTGRENIYLNGAVLGMKKKEIDRKFDQIVEFSGIEKFIDTPVKRYSSGMTVRLAFSIAAHLEPDILIIDEVLAVGDLSFQRKCLGKMENTIREGRTIIFVSHNMAAVSALCPKSILLDHGRIIFEGPSAEAIRQYTKEADDYFNEPVGRRIDRQGTGAVRVKEFLIENESGDAVGSIGCNEKLSFKISYEATEKYKDLRFIISVYDENEQRVLRFDSAINFLRFEEWPKAGVVNCLVSRPIGLKPGGYRTHFAVLVGSSMADYVVNATRFDVIEGDFFGTGKLYQDWPMFLVSNEWRLLC